MAVNHTPILLYGEDQSLQSIKKKKKKKKKRKKKKYKKKKKKKKKKKYIKFMMLHKFILYHIIFRLFYKSYDN